MAQDLKFCQTGEISPNLVTMGYIFLTAKYHDSLSCHYLGGMDLQSDKSTQYGSSTVQLISSFTS